MVSKLDYICLKESKFLILSDNLMILGVEFNEDWDESKFIKKKN